jgi:hypothetical protein
MPGSYSRFYRLRVKNRTLRKTSANNAANSWATANPLKAFMRHILREKRFCSIIEFFCMLSVFLAGRVQCKQVIVNLFETECSSQMQKIVAVGKRRLAELFTTELTRKILRV